MKKSMYILIIALLVLTFFLFNENGSLSNRVDVLETENDELKNEIMKIEQETATESETSISIENLAVELMSKAQLSDKEIEVLYILLPNVNIREFNDICEKVNSGLDYELTIDWAFENIEFSNQENMNNLFELNDNLDGAYSEGYSYYIGKLYESDRVVFLRSITHAPQYTEKIFSSIAYDMFEQERWIEESRNLQKLMEDNQFNLEEQETINEFIKLLGYYIKNGI